MFKASQPPTLFLEDNFCYFGPEISSLRDDYLNSTMYYKYYYGPHTMWLLEKSTAKDLIFFPEQVSNPSPKKIKV